MARIPVVDMARCTLCEGCLEVCPQVFRLNPAGYMEIAEMDEYPEDCVQEAINCCPTDCIEWEDS